MRNGFTDPDVCLRIIPFQELSRYGDGWVENELSRQDEEEQLRKEEVDAAFASQGLDGKEEEDDEELEVDPW